MKEDGLSSMKERALSSGVRALGVGGAWWAWRSCADRRRSDRARRGPGCQATDLSVAQAVEAEGEDPPRDGDLGDLLAAALGDALVAVAQRAAAARGVLGGLDQRPAQRRGAP